LLSPLQVSTNQRDRQLAPSSVPATTKTYTDNQAGCRSDHAYGGPCVPWRGIIHTALLADLPHKSLVRYRCGTAGLMSAARNFTSRPHPEGEDEQGSSTVKFGLLGDRAFLSFPQPPSGGLIPSRSPYNFHCSIRFSSAVGILRLRQGPRQRAPACGTSMAAWRRTTTPVSAATSSTVVLHSSVLTLSR
jgi:hypothetical protein